MADLYGTNPRDSSSSESFESEEMSSFLQNYLNNSSIKGKNAQVFNSQQPIAGGFSDSDGRLSDLSGYFSKESMSKSLSSNATTSLNFPLHDDSAGFDFGCQAQKFSEAQKNPIPPRSSKRTRAAEIHNMSEKRRRSRINEKLKALQTLIPNSNKTDKASMLDEAIEYLKQLQLQVQTLTMKTGLGLPPIYIQELAIQRGMGYDEANKSSNPNVGTSTFPQDQDMPILREFDISHHTNMPSLTNMMKSETPFSLELPAENQHGFINHLASMKDIYRVNRPPKLATELPFSGKIPSPGVSS